VFGTIYDIGDALGPISAGILVAGFGYARMFQVMGAIAAVMATVFAFTTAGPSGRRTQSGRGKVCEDLDSRC
jgi:sugar phosphate permease